MSNEKSTTSLLETLKKKTSYENIRDELTDSQYCVNLAEYLHGIAEERGMKQSDILRCSGLKKSYFYQLFHGEKEKPSRDTLVQLGFGFGFGVEEMQAFLKHLNTAQLYPRIARDGVIIYALQHGLDIVKCDILLDENGEEPLTKV